MLQSLNRVPSAIFQHILGHLSLKEALKLYQEPSTQQLLGILQKNSKGYSINIEQRHRWAKWMLKHYFLETNIPESGAYEKLKERVSALKDIRPRYENLLRGGLFSIYERMDLPARLLFLVEKYRYDSEAAQYCLERIPLMLRVVYQKYPSEAPDFLLKFRKNNRWGVGYTQSFLEALERGIPPSTLFEWGNDLSAQMRLKNASEFPPISPISEADILPILLPKTKETFYRLSFRGRPEQLGQCVTIITSLADFQKKIKDLKKHVETLNFDELVIFFRALSQADARLFSMLIQKPFFKKVKQIKIPSNIFKDFNAQTLNRIGIFECETAEEIQRIMKKVRSLAFIFEKNINECPEIWWHQDYPDAVHRLAFFLEKDLDGYCYRELKETFLKDPSLLTIEAIDQSFKKRCREERTFVFFWSLLVYFGIALFCSVVPMLVMSYYEFPVGRPYFDPEKGRMIQDTWTNCDISRVPLSSLLCMWIIPCVVCFSFFFYTVGKHLWLSQQSLKA